MMFRTAHIIALAFLFLSSTAMAQVTSNGSLFSLPEGSGCAPYGASGEFVFNAPQCDGSITCAIDFDYDGTTFDTDPNFPIVFHNTPILFTYPETTEPRTYRIAIIFGAGGTLDELEFTVYPQTPPDFNVYVCSGNSVQVEITDPDFPSYEIDFNNDNVFDASSPGGLVPPHDYGVSGPQTINVRPTFTNCNTGSRSFTTGTFTPNGHGISRLLTTSEGEINLDLVGTGNSNILFQLDRSTNNGAFDELEQLTDITSYSDLNVAAGQNFYCYRVGAIDICTSPIPNFTNTICSVRPILAVGDGANTVSWVTNTSGATALDVTRNFEAPAPLPLTNNGVHPDTDVTCGNEYCYNFTMSYGAAESISQTVCGLATSSQPPPAVQEVTTIVEGGGVHLEWLALENFAVSKYDLFKIPDIYLSEATTTVPAYDDNSGYNEESGNCYRIRFDDVCKNRSEVTEDICTLHLKAVLDEATNAVTLSWEPYNGYAVVQRYVIEKYDESNAKIEEFDAGLQTSFTDNSAADGQIFTYRLKAFSAAPGIDNASTSNRVTIILSPRLWHPDAFIPDGSDSRNQTFSVKGSSEYIGSYELRIFNRWGEMVFYSNDMETGWDGTFKGIKMPEGTYAFRTKVIDNAGRTFDYSGAVILLRK
jgi:gliding motility-associated-like protein